MSHAKYLTATLALAIALAAIACSGDTATTIDATPWPGEAYTTGTLDRVRINSHADQENYQRVYADLDLHGGPFASVIVTLDLGSTCFPWTDWVNNPPPPGENWPADCDAFDRLYQVTIDPKQNDSQDLGFEVVRAITPFGTGSHIEVDITDLANALSPGLHKLEVHVSTSSDAAGRVTGSNGGWFITVRADVTPGLAPRNVLAAIPLVHRTDYENQKPAIGFTLPEGTTSSAIEYRVTGHGGGPVESGCIGPSEEFCDRTHSLFIDEQPEAPFQAWINSCAHMCDQTSTAYCAQNPMGNIQSVRAPRANWCPGAVTPPRVFPLSVGPGAHTFRYDISRIASPSGRWTVSATAFAYGDPAQ
jgi:hypothetical protein